MQFRHSESYRILSDGRILQDPMGSGVGYVDLGAVNLQGVYVDSKQNLYVKLKIEDFCGLTKI
jgi:hypothetical protein